MKSAKQTSASAETSMTSTIEAVQVTQVETSVNNDLETTNQVEMVSTTPADTSEAEAAIVNYVRPHELSHTAEGYTPKPFDALTFNTVENDKQVQLKKVSRDLIKTTGLNVRDTRSYDLQDLIASIKENGLNQAINVYEEKDKETGITYYYIIDGHRRFAAINQIGGPFMVRVAVEKKPKSEVDIFAKQYHTSATSKSFTQLEIAMLCYQLHVVYNLSVGKIAQKLAIKATRVSSYLKLLQNSSGTVVDMIADGKVTISTVQQAINQVREEDGTSRGEEVNAERVEEIIQDKIESGEITETGRKVHTKNNSSKKLVSDKELNKGNKKAPNAVADQDFETTLEYPRLENFIQYYKTNTDSNDIHPTIKSHLDFLFDLLVAFQRRNTNKQIYDSLILGMDEQVIPTVSKTSTGTTIYEFLPSDDEVESFANDND